MLNFSQQKKLTSLFHRIFKFRKISSYFLNLKSFYRYKYWYRDFIKLFVLQIKSPSPALIPIRISRRILDLVVWDSLDRMTVNEIFCWECYKYNSSENNIILYLGGNIGLSAKYFLAKNPNSKIYIFEPNSNLKSKIKHQLKEFKKDRFFIDSRAIGPSEGKVTLTNEFHSRYNFIDYKLEISDSTVDAINLKSAIDECRIKFGSCDILKIDIEGFGFEVLDSIPLNFPHRPLKIYIEEDVIPNLELLWLKSNYIHSTHLSGIHIYKIREK